MNLTAFPEGESVISAFSACGHASGLFEIARVLVRFNHVAR
jgi:hypothetical protein